MLFDPCNRESRQAIWCSYLRNAELGYVRNSDLKVKTYSETEKNHTATFTIGATGYHKFYITNKSSGSVTVTGGSLTF